MQNAVVGVVKEQKQLLGQGWMALQVPLQAKPLGSLRNCRAETVPALKTAMTMAPNKKFCVVFLMIDSPFHTKSAAPVRYFARDWAPVGCDKQVPVVASRAKAQTQPVEH